MISTGRCSRLRMEKSVPTGLGRNLREWFRGLNAGGGARRWSLVGEGRSGMVRLLQFYDGLALHYERRAMRWTEAGIAPAIEEIDGDATVGLPGSFHAYWVDAGKDFEPMQSAIAAMSRSLGCFKAGTEADELLRCGGG